MSARYWALVSDELIASGPCWPAGLRLLKPLPLAGAAAMLPRTPGMRWWLFEDDNAPEELGGACVDLTFGTQDGTDVITGRDVIYGR